MPAAALAMPRFHTAVVALTLLATAGCSTLDPYVSVGDPGIRARMHEGYSIEAAEAYGEALRARYRGALSEQALLSNAVSLALIPTAVVATSLGVRGVGANTILGLGLGAAGAVTGVNVLVSQPRQRIYAAGATAVGCVLEAFADLRAAERAARNLPGTEPADAGSGATALVAALARLSAQRAALAGELSGAFFNLQNLPSVAAAKAAVERADRAQLAGRQAADALARGGLRLAGAFEAIEDTVNTAVLSTIASPEALLASISGRLTQGASAFAPVVAPRFEMGRAGSLSSDPAAAARLDAPTARLAALAEAVDGVARLAANAPTVETVRACLTGESLSVRPFALTPPDRLTLVRTSPELPDVVLVTGGTGRYSWGWIGATPPGIGARLIYDESFVGNLLLTVEPVAGPGTWQLFVSDGQSAPRVLEIGFGASTAPRPTASGGTVTPAAAGSAPVRALQRALADRGALPASGIDGLVGQATRTALFATLPDATEAEVRAILAAASPTGAVASLLARPGPVPSDWRVQIGLASPPPPPGGGTTTDPVILPDNEPPMVVAERRLNARLAELGCGDAAGPALPVAALSAANDAMIAAFLRDLRAAITERGLSETAFGLNDSMNQAEVDAAVAAFAAATGGVAFRCRG